MKKISNKILFYGAAALLLFLSGFYYIWSQREIETEKIREMQSTKVATEVMRIVAFGDSLTAGYGLPLDESYPALLEEALRQKGISVEVINSGVSGETSAGGVRRAEFIRGLEPDIVLFGLGGNDALRLLSPEELEKNLTLSLDILLAGEVPPRILLLGMRAPGNADSLYRKSFDAVYPRVAEKYALPLVPFLLEGVALDPRYSLPDGIHPNVAGYRIVVEQNILPILLPLLEIEK